MHTTRLSILECGDHPRAVRLHSFPYGNYFSDKPPLYTTTEAIFSFVRIYVAPLLPERPRILYFVHISLVPRVMQALSSHLFTAENTLLDKSISIGCLHLQTGSI